MLNLEEGDAQEGDMISYLDDPAPTKKCTYEVQAINLDGQYSAAASVDVDVFKGIGEA